MFVLAFRLAVSQLRQKLLSRLIVVASVASILILNALVILVFQGFSRSLAEIQSSRIVTAYLESSVQPAREPEMISAVKKIRGVTDAQMVSKEAFVENFSKYFPQLSTELSSLDSDTIPRYIKVKVNSQSESNVENVQKQLGQLKGIEYIELNASRYSGLIGALSSLKKFALVMIGGLSLALICILFNHFRLRTGFQTQVRNTMKALGASGSQILVPFAMEGVLEGGVAGFLAGGVLYLYGRFFESQLNSLFVAIGYHPYHFQLAGLAAGAVVIGMMAGLIGSLWATTQKIRA